MSVTKLLALDTSTTKTGYAYFENGKIKESGVIDLSKGKDSALRYENMFTLILERFNQYNPDIVVIELPPLVKDPWTLIKLSKIVGAVKGWAHQKCEYIEYLATEWRAIVKEGNETLPKGRDLIKKWDIDKFIKCFNYSPKDDNEADAGLIGLARIKEVENIINGL